MKKILKKKLLRIMICLVLVSSLGIVAYAAWIKYTYLPGTTDPVQNMPEEVSRSFYDGPYRVPNIIPTREGYVFDGWKLNYELETPPEKATYIVRYMDNSTCLEIAPSKTVVVDFRATVTEYPKLGTELNEGYENYVPEQASIEKMIFGDEFITFWYNKPEE